jgi:hypothetical protein
MAHPAIPLSAAGAGALTTLGSTLVIKGHESTTGVVLRERPASQRTGIIDQIVPSR